MASGPVWFQTTCCGASARLSVRQSDDIDLCYLTRPCSLARSVYAIAKRDRRNTKRSQLVCGVRLLAPRLSHGVTAQV